MSRTSSRWLRVLVVLLAVAAVAAAALFAFAWRPEIAGVEPPQRAAVDARLIERGSRLASAGNCLACHTVEGGLPLAGGLPVATPFGTIYSTNITPDPDTGIGRWSQGAFTRSMREGVSRRGSHLYPAFPYTHFTRVDDDLRALYAYLMARTPVRAPARDNELTFPFGFRPLLAGWKLLFFEPGMHRADPARGPEWNRGAYLVEGLTHCSACHSRRNAFGADRSPGRGRGFAFARYKNFAGYAAIAIEAEVQRETGRIHVLRAVAAVDSGDPVNPDGIRNQIEGGIIQSLSWTLFEGVSHDRTRITSVDWSGYPILRFSSVPHRIEVHVVSRPGQPFLGTGESAQGPAGAALANAVADATGVRLREVPFTAQRVRTATGA